MTRLLAFALLFAVSLAASAAETGTAAAVRGVLAADKAPHGLFTLIVERKDGA
jgi:hypothetical protein